MKEYNLILGTCAMLRPDPMTTEEKSHTSNVKGMKFKLWY
jgi:hypothetical protein